MALAGYFYRKRFCFDFMERQIVSMSNDIAKASTALGDKLMNDPLLAHPIYEKIIDVFIRNHRRLLDALF